MTWWGGCRSRLGWKFEGNEWLQWNDWVEGGRDSLGTRFKEGRDVGKLS